MNLSRNAPCPCDSGKRYKHCCGASQNSKSAVLTQAQSAVPALLEQALALQKADHVEAAARLYEEVLKAEPGNPSAHNMLAVIYGEKWRMVEALHHAHKSGEVTKWRDPFFYHNYTVLISKALRNVENARYRQACRNYLDAFGASTRQPAPSPRISILIFERASSAELKQCFKSIAEQSLQPHEILVAAGSVDSIMQQSWPFCVRMVDLSSNTEAERINHLADVASGDFLLALRKEDTLLPDHLSRLVGVAGASGGWTFASNKPPQPGTTISEEDLPTAGFSLLSKVDYVVTSSNLLVPRELHQRVGGYNPTNPTPLLDYCLRLLWEVEPASIINETCLAGSRVEEAASERLSTIGDYLDKAFNNYSPNPYAPSKQNWGFRLHLHIAKQELFITVPFMAVLNREIENYLVDEQEHPIRPEPGVNLIGPARGEFGLGENMRAIARSCLEGSIPCAIRDPNFALPTRQSDSSLDEHLAQEAQHNCSIFFFNPDLRKFYSSQLDSVVFERPSVDFRHIKIGYWFWELEKAPAQWEYAFAKMDEIWVATEFIATSMRRATNKPVIKMPTPIGFEIKGNYDRNYFGLPSNVFLFLFSFDFNSYPERKNPYALIRAFQRAFPRQRQDVALVVKSVNGTKRPEAMHAMQEQVVADSRIILKNEFMTRDEVCGLQGVVDAYVSLHRAEGFGLGLAECMYQGKPVIGTAYSGNLEYMNESNSGLVNYSLVPIRRGEYHYDDPGFFWAEPDEEHAAYLMAKLVEDNNFRNRIAAQGQKDIRSGFNYADVAKRMKARLREIGVI